MRTALDISSVIGRASCKTGKVIRAMLSGAVLGKNGSPVTPPQVN